MPDWKIYTLEFSNADIIGPGEEIGRFLEGLWPSSVIRNKVPPYFQTRDILIKGIEKIDGRQEKIIAVFPDNGMHHYTYGLCRRADRLSERYIYGHFSTYPDDLPLFETDENTELKPGTIIEKETFVSAILRDTHAAGVVHFGTNAKYHTPRIKSECLSGITDIYPSIDFSILDPSEFSYNTKWGRGEWKLDELVHNLRLLKSQKNIISADCVGYVGFKDPKSLLTYACICALLMGEDASPFVELHSLAKRDKLDYGGMQKKLGINMD